METEASSEFQDSLEGGRDAGLGGPREDGI